MDARTEQAYQQRVFELEALVADCSSQLAQRNATIAALQQQAGALSKPAAE